MDAEEPTGRTLGGIDFSSVPFIDELSNSGTPPYRRGIHEKMYLTRRWTMRQYAGFSTAEATNKRFKLLLNEGQKGLSVAFDLPTQLGMDSDDDLDLIVGAGDGTIKYYENTGNKSIQIFTERTENAN